MNSKEKILEILGQNVEITSIFKQTNIWINVIDSKMNVVMWNKTAAKISGYKSKEVVGHNKIWKWLYPSPAYRKEITEKAAAILHEGKRVSTLETKIRCKNGEIKTIRWHSNNLYSLKKELLGSIAIGVDITSATKTESMLRQMATRYKTLFDGLSDAVILSKDKSGQIIDTNAAAAKLFAISQKRLVWMNIKELYRHKNKRHANLKRQSAKDGGASSVEIGEIVNRQGKIIPVEVTQLSFEMEGTLVRQSIFRDISKRIKDEAEIRKSQEMYKELVESSGSVILKLDHEGRVAFLNEYAQDFFGFSEKEIIGKNCVGTIVPKRDSHGFNLDKKVKSLMLDPLKYHISDNENIKKDGTRVWMAWTNKPIFDEKGRMVGTFSVGNEITELKKAQKALKESEEKYRILTENILTGVFVYQGDKVIYANPAAEKITGYKAKEVKNVRDIVHPDDRYMFVMRSRERFLNKGGSSGVDLRIVKKNGEIVWVNGFASKITFNGADALIGGIIDITETKNAEEENRRLAAQLQQAQKLEAVGTLAGGVAHDFNNVLASVIGFSTLLEMELPKGSEHNKYANHILAAAERGRDLSMNLLGFARKGDYNIIALDINELILNVVQILSHTLPKKIKIETVLEETPIFAKVDSNQITHAIINICINSRDAMPNGGVLKINAENVSLGEKQIKRMPSLTAGKYARISIIDNGAGISSEHIDHIFEPFFSTKPPGAGSGLGLSMAYGVIKKLGGYIKIESVVDKGTEVIFFIPLTDRKVAKKRPGKAKKNKRIARGRGCILIIDDEMMVLDATGYMLSKLGYRVFKSETISEGLKVLKNNVGVISLIILDIVMPDIKGDKTMEDILAIAPDVKVLLSSGYTLEDSARDMIKKGAKGYIQKPFEFNNLAEIINELIKDK